MIEIKEHRNAKYISEKIIDCEINHPNHGWIPFACNPDDTGSDVDIDKLYTSLKASNPTAYTPPTEEEINEQKAIEIRMQRDSLLRRDVDPLVTNPLRWDSLSTEVQNKVKTYRNALLDIPEQTAFPTSVSFPKKDF
tara:strand:- start:200 stop:610 length:411 start_codon:yes stop_codon:yes gene_type:complete